MNHENIKQQIKPKIQFKNETKKQTCETTQPPPIKLNSFEKGFLMLKVLSSGKIFKVPVTNLENKNVGDKIIIRFENNTHATNSTETSSEEAIVLSKFVNNANNSKAKLTTAYNAPLDSNVKSASSKNKINATNQSNLATGIQSRTFRYLNILKENHKHLKQKNNNAINKNAIDTNASATTTTNVIKISVTREQIQNQQQIQVPIKLENGRIATISLPTSIFNLSESAVVSLRIPITTNDNAKQQPKSPLPPIVYPPVENHKLLESVLIMNQPFNQSFFQNQKVIQNSHQLIQQQQHFEN